MTNPFVRDNQELACGGCAWQAEAETALAKFAWPTGDGRGDGDGGKALQLSE